MNAFRVALISLILGLTLGAVAMADTPPATYTVINATTTTTVKASPGIFFGVTSQATQATVVSCFDNTALSGPLLWTGTPTAVAPSVGIPAGGIAFTTGLTCAIATSVVAPGYTVLWK